MEKKLVWKILLEEGESALNALKYSEAEVIFSKVMNSHNVPYPFEKTIIFLWIIAIFHLKGFFSLKRILFLISLIQRNPCYLKILEIHLVFLLLAEVLVVY